ncbi:MAG: hypothetical protein ACHQ4H_05635 [Ktedonobacterales bacterium]
MSMRCANCGGELRGNEPLCPHCGLVREPATGWRAEQGVPVAAYTPSPAGPPVAAQALPTAGNAAPAPEVTVTPPHEMPRLRAGYRPVVLPAPPHPRGRPAGRGLLTALALLAVLGLAAGIVARQGHVPIPGLAVAATQPAPTATTALACLASPIGHFDHAALGAVVMASALRNPGQHDYRPVAAATRFRAGTTAYITFQVLSTSAGNIGVNVCTPGHRLVGPLSIPRGSNGRYAEFPITLVRADAGSGIVTITWDGVVAANLAFTVVA